MLYPLKFKPILKEKIWGGRRLGEKLGKRLPAGRAVGESWELSGLDGNRSVVRNGPLKGNDLDIERLYPVRPSCPVTESECFIIQSLLYISSYQSVLG